ncbi:MAG: acetyl-CoA carboxylase biotin carboxyl carrier protein [Xanthomonadales bacterium]|nr:acetyl-CoA carboxylase biotin carboxyl carrier protein [Xanthomonadales bacterium]
MDLRKIKKLVEILEESNLSELEIHENDESIRLSRHGAGEPTMFAGYPPPQGYAPPPTGAPAQKEERESDGEETEPELAEGHVIRSPMVGTYYAAPNPDSEPFVSVGQNIKAGDTVCIIEAMKMFNQIESDINGKVVAVLVDNAQPVEFDQPLFIVR